MANIAVRVEAGRVFLSYRYQRNGREWEDVGEAVALETTPFNCSRHRYTRRGRFAVTVDDSNTDPVVIPLATPDSTCEVTIPRDQYDREAVAAMADRWTAVKGYDLPIEKDPRRWRSAEITAPDGRAIKATMPNGWGQASWQRFARDYFPRGYVVRALDPVDLTAHVVDQAAAAEQAEEVVTPFCLSPVTEQSPFTRNWPGSAVTTVPFGSQAAPGRAAGGRDPQVAPAPRPSSPWCAAGAVHRGA